MVPEQIERIRDACLSAEFATYLQDRNETVVVVLADTGLRVSELVALDWEYIDLGVDPGELYLPSEVQKGNPAPPILISPTRRADNSVATGTECGKTARQCSRRDRLIG